MLFNSSQKLFQFSRYVNVCLNFVGMKKKRLDQKNKVNFKIYDVNAWLAKNYEENEADKPVPDSLLFFKRALYQIKAKDLQVDFTVF